MQFANKLRELTNGSIDHKEVERGINAALTQCEHAAKRGESQIELDVMGNLATINAKVYQLREKGLRVSYYNHHRLGDRLILAW